MAAEFAVEMNSVAGAVNSAMDGQLINRAANLLEIQV